MDINFKGLVDLHTLPTTEPLLPLYEAIVNSIQSINQENMDNGQIEVQIQRESDPTFFKVGKLILKILRFETMV